LPSFAHGAGVGRWRRGVIVARVRRRLAVLAAGLRWRLRVLNARMRRRPRVLAAYLRWRLCVFTRVR
jgi:hypothetical protein